MKILLFKVGSFEGAKSNQRDIFLLQKLHINKQSDQQADKQTTRKKIPIALKYTVCFKLKMTENLVFLTGKGAGAGNETEKQEKQVGIRNSWAVSAWREFTSLTPMFG